VGAVVFAPLFGGYLIEHMDWRWVFYAVIPLGAFASVWSWIFLPATKPSHGRRLEWWGFIALIIFVGTLQTALSRGERLDWFDSAEIQLQFVVAAIAFVVVLFRVLTAAQPIVERRLFVDRNFSFSIVFMVLFGGLTTLPVVLLPIMLQQVSGYPPDTAGELMLSRGIGSVVSLLLVGFLMTRFDPRIVLATGFGFYAITNVFMSTWTSSINEWWVVWTNLVQGAASGTTYVPIVTLALATLARQLHTEAITFLFLAFNLGSAFGVAAVFSLYTRLVQVNHSVLAEHVTANNEVFQLPGAREAWDPNTPTGLAALAAEISRQAEMIAYVNAFLVVGIVAAAVVPLVLIVRKPES
jgi:DHA2 family multidrug resistance protein